MTNQESSYQDPFQTTTILTFDKFINRENSVEKILGKFRTGGHTSLLGNRRIGKSSLLRYLTFSESRQLFEPRYNLGDYLVLYLDPQDVTINRPEDFAAFVFKGSKQWLETNGYVTNETKHLDKNLDPTLQNLNEFIYRIKKKFQLTIVVLIDEFEYFCKGALLGEAFFKKLRALGDQQYLLYVTCSSKTLEELTRESRVAGSEFWNIFTNEFIGLFSENNVRSLIDKYLAISRTVTFPDEDINFILNRIGLHPYFVQRACGKLYSFRFHNNGDTVPNYEQMYDDLLQEEWQRLGAYFNNLSDHQKAFALRFLNDSSVLKSYVDTSTPNILQSAIIVDDGRGDFDFFSPLFRDYLIKNIQIDNSKGNLPNKPKAQQKVKSEKNEISDTTTELETFIEQARSAAIHQLEVNYAEALSDWRENKNEADRHVERLRSAGMEDVVDLLETKYNLMLEKELEELQAVYTILSKTIHDADKGITLEKVITILGKGWPRLKDVK